MLGLLGAYSNRLNRLTFTLSRTHPLVTLAQICPLESWAVNHVKDINGPAPFHDSQGNLVATPRSRRPHLRIAMRFGAGRCRFRKRESAHDKSMPFPTLAALHRG